MESFDEINTLKSYDISEIINKYKTKDLLLALSEGAATGALGFSGLPFNLVLSNFLYFRAVQSIAMYYGYDVKNDPSELVIASSVYTNALSPSNSDLNNELSASIAKIVLISKATIIQQTSKKTWSAMIERGGATLLLTQIRALSNKAAANALQKAGQKGLENSIFKETFELIGEIDTKNNS
ncbi:EcsC family protein [Streptococcus parauberis]|nr:EcsC family protein [Streptococcus parauberis]